MDRFPRFAARRRLDRRHWTLAANTGTSGEIRLSMASPGGTVSRTGIVVILEFEVIGEPAASTPLTFETATLNDGAVTTEHQNGLFTVDATYSLTGNVRFWKSSSSVQNTNIALSGERDFSTSTDSDGAFSLNGIDADPYTLTATKSDEATGISAYDATLILKHAAGLATLSGHAATAADVNRSGQINSMDAYLVLQRAVGLIDLPFPGAGMTWTFSPEDRTYEDLSSNLTNQNFTAILLGDVSGNWNGTESDPQSLQPSGATVVLHEIQIPGTDEIVARILMANGIPVTESLELALTHSENQTLENVIPGQMLTGYSHAFNTGEPQTIRAAMAGVAPLTGSDVLLTLRFRGEGASGLSLDKYSINEGRYSLTLRDDIAPFDTDGDGLIDIDETEIFGTNAESQDTTGDGISDTLALRLGLDPADASSRFVLTNVTPATGDTISITWPTRPGNTYRIEYTDDLTTPWQTHGTPITATTTETTIALPQGETPHRFYRVVFEETKEQP